MVTGVPGYSSSAPSWQQQQAFAQGVGGPGLSSSGGYDPSMAMASPYAYTTSSSSSSQQSSSSFGLGDLIGGIFKGAVNSVKSLFSLKGALMIGAGLVGMAVAPEIVGPALLALGVGTTVFQGLKGICGFISAGGDPNKEEAAAENIGGAAANGLLIWGGSALGGVFKSGADTTGDTAAAGSEVSASDTVADAPNGVRPSLTDRFQALRTKATDQLGTTRDNMLSEWNYLRSDDGGVPGWKANLQRNLPSWLTSRIPGLSSEEASAVQSASADDAALGKLGVRQPSIWDSQASAADPANVLMDAKIEVENLLDEGTMPDSELLARAGLTGTYENADAVRAALDDRAMDWSVPQSSGPVVTDGPAPVQPKGPSFIQRALQSKTLKEVAASAAYSGAILSPFNQPSLSQSDLSGLTPDQYAALQQYAAAQGGTIA